MSLSDTSHSMIQGTLVSLALVWGIVKLYGLGSREPHLPPGPPTKPVLGNLSILPRKETYLKFTEWARQYGSVYSLKVGTSTVIVISSLEAICQILEKNGALTADRPQRAALIRIFGTDGSISAAAYGPVWRNRRKAISEIVKPSACAQHIPIQMAETSQLMRDLQQDPENFFIHIQRAILSVIFSVVCGVRTEDITSPVLARHFHLTSLLMEIAEPGNTPPIDLIPVLNYVPDGWLGNWKARCDRIRQLHRESTFGLLEDIEERRKRGLHNGCYLETLLDNAEEWDLDREAIAYISAGLIMGGSNTTTATLHFAVLLATAFPNAQRKAREELDRVVGSDRSPTLEDMANLPYINAFLQEIHRFRTIVPLAVPHLAMEDQIYEEYLVPKGSTIFLNIWALYHDPELFEDPDNFDPERYIRSPYGVKPGVEEYVDVESLKKLETLRFGAGRRICPGNHLAINSIALIVSSLLWGFEFLPSKDEAGNDIEPDVWGFSSRITLDPLPFKCTIRPRSSRHCAIIDQNYRDRTHTFDEFEKS